MTTSAVSRKGKTRAQIEMEVRHREVEAVCLRALNMSYADIADQLGWANDTAARRAVQRALLRQEEISVRELRRVEDANLDQLEARLAKILDRRWTLMDDGKVVYGVVEEVGADGMPVLTQVPLEDPGPHLTALGLYCQVLALRAALHGLDVTPRGDDESVASADMIEAEITRIEELAKDLDQGQRED